MATYYVATTGTDSNSGSISAPWRTLQTAFNRFTSGDTLLIRGGTYGQTTGGTVDSGTRLLSNVTIHNYPGETVIIERPHNSANALFIKNYRYLLIGSHPSGGTLKLRNTGTFPNEVGDFVTSALRIYDNPSFAQRAAFNIVDGLVVEQFFGNGIFLDGTQDSVVRNCETSWCATGIRLEGTRSTAEDNYAHDNRYMHQSDTTNPDNDAGAMGISLTRDNGFKVLRNVITGCWAIIGSPDYGTDGGALEMFGTNGGIIGGLGNGQEWTKWGHSGFGNGNVGYQNHNFLETGRLSTDPNNDNVEVSYNICYGKNDYQNLQGEAATTSYFLIRAFKNGHIHHNVWDVDDGFIANAGLRFQQGGTYGGDITGITIEDNIIRNRFSTPSYQFGNLALPSGLTIRNNLVYYAFDYTSNVLVRSGNDYTLSQLATAQSETGKLQDEIWGDTNTNPGANPLFVNSTTSTMAARDYSLQTGSPAIGAGHDGSNIGAYQTASTGGGGTGGSPVHAASFTAGAWLRDHDSFSADAVIRGGPTFTASALITNASLTGRWLHHRLRDHFGYETDLNVVTSRQYGPYEEGTPIYYVINDLLDRLAALEGSTHKVFSFTADAVLLAATGVVETSPGTWRSMFTASADIKRTITPTFTANSRMAGGGSFSANAVLRGFGTFTANAVVV